VHAHIAAGARTPDSIDGIAIDARDFRFTVKGKEPDPAEAAVRWVIGGKAE